MDIKLVDEQERNRLAAMMAEVNRKHDEHLVRVSHDICMTTFTGLQLKDIRTKTLENYVPESEQQILALDVANRWSPDQGFGLTFCGPTGTGKTHLSKGILLKWCNRTLLGQFTTMASYFDAARADLDSLPLITEQLCTPKILVVDDIGAEKATEWTTERFLTVIEKRLTRGNITFFTTNLSIVQIAQKYGPRIADRISELTAWIQVEGPSFRQKIASQNLSAVMPKPSASQNGTDNQRSVDKTTKD